MVSRPSAHAALDARDRQSAVDLRSDTAPSLRVGPIPTAQSFPPSEISKKYKAHNGSRGYDEQRFSRRRGYAALNIDCRTMDAVGGSAFPGSLCDERQVPRFLPLYCTVGDPPWTTLRACIRRTHIRPRRRRINLHGDAIVVQRYCNYCTAEFECYEVIQSFVRKLRIANLRLFFADLGHQRMSNSAQCEWVRAVAERLRTRYCEDSPREATHLLFTGTLS